MSEPKPLLIVAAMTVEVEPLARRLGLARDGDAPMIAWADGETVIGVTGPGRDRAARRTTEAIERFDPARVVLTGFAGSLSESLHPGDTIHPAALIDGAGGDRLTPSLDLPGVDRSGTMVTVDRIASSADAKRTLASRYGADAVDMETFAAATACIQRRVPWLCLRAISDRLDQAVPEGLVGLVSDAGEPDLAAATRWAMTHPMQMPAMLRLKANCDRAAAALADSLERDTLAPLR